MKQTRPDLAFHEILFSAKQRNFDDEQFCDTQ